MVRPAGCLKNQQERTRKKPVTYAAQCSVDLWSPLKRSKTPHMPMSHVQVKYMWHHKASMFLTWYAISANLLLSSARQCSFDSAVCKMHVFFLMPLVGSVSMALAEKCWGTVEVCRDGKCGGVCTDTWRSNEDSKMICENLRCGDPIQGPLTRQINDLPVSYYSVYCSENVRNMNMCKFIPNKDSDCKTAAQVICKGNVYSCFIHDRKFMLTPALFIRTLGLSLLKIVKA